MISEERKPLLFLSPIHRSTRQITLHLESRVAALGVAAREAHLLSYLRSYEPASVGRLRRIFGFKASTLTSLLDRLEGKKLLRRKIHARDRRSYLVELTAGGRRVADSVCREIEQLENDIASRVGERQLAGFRTVMKAIAEVTEIDLQRKERS
jgi:DNA-binding MarR family transcriptional regulator